MRFYPHKLCQTKSPVELICQMRLSVTRALLHDLSRPGALINMHIAHALFNAGHLLFWTHRSHNQDIGVVYNDKPQNCEAYFEIWDFNYPFIT